MTLLGERKTKSGQNQPKHYQQLPRPTPQGSRPQSPTSPQRPDGSVGSLVAQLSEQVSRLVRDEMELVELEAKQRTKRIGIAAGALGLGGALAFFGACCLATAAILALAMVMRPWAAALVVGAAFFIVSGMFGTPGMWGVVRGSRGVGKESVESVKADVAAVREAVHR